ncbi:thioredoxin [Nanoarchaeota archaeon]
MKELGKDDFEDAKKGNAVIDFWAPWCGPCKVMGPNFDAAGDETEGVNFFKVNVDDEPELAGEYGVRSIPTLVFMKNGEKLDATMGTMNKDAILDKVKEVFG